MANHGEVLSMGRGCFGWRGLSGLVWVVVTQLRETILFLKEHAFVTLLFKNLQVNEVEKEKNVRCFITYSIKFLHNWYIWK